MKTAVAPSYPFTQAAVRDVMTPGVISCPAETPLRVVARMMTAYRVHAVVVFDDRDDFELERGWGIVSDLDLVAAGALADERTAGGTAASPLVTVSPAETVERAAQLMVENEVTHLVVAEPGARRPAGIISTLDVARAIAAEAGTTS